MTITTPSTKTKFVMRLLRSVVLVLCLGLSPGCVAFSKFKPSNEKRCNFMKRQPFPTPTLEVSSRKQPPSCWRKNSPLRMSSQNDDTSSPSTIWSPQLRKIMGGIASMGVVETGYLTYTKWFTDGRLPAFCGTSGGGGGSGGCESVLTGPYATIPHTDVPLATLGLVAYSLVLYLAVTPLVSSSSSSSVHDDQNRILLTALTTCMGTFSVFLMSLLFGVLHQTCPYCIFSAACSILLAQLAWIGGCLPENSTPSMSKATALASGLLVPTAAALWLYFGVPAPVSSLEYTMNGGNGNLLVASTATGSTTRLASGEVTPLYRPPEITAVSTERATILAKELQSLNAKMYGAHWCSHCYDQKQVFGREAFNNYIKYIECSVDGVNSQSKLCKVMDVPGYPTWEIQGRLYPGQLELEELEELVNGILDK